MRLMDWMMEGSLDISEVPYRHSRVGIPRRMVWALAALLAFMTFVFLVAGAILTAIVFTEVRPPTADENYQRYLGADYRRNIGPLMMILAFVIFVTGVICLFGRKFSHQEDKKQMAILQEHLYTKTSQHRQQQSPERRVHDTSHQSIESN
ncbi:hypothetical protein BIW11_09377 [Tropilaelaps mercedesae]|uniref:Transmembrane protein-like n=1 Tax=Tropilaelaps mercedesae TaxID=418985 RepID=A0A1V9XKF8_9ACAR|nr:hypothetical protein BIW11_09377 [Tropilaelaps mercedesae]